MAITKLLEAGAVTILISGVLEVRWDTVIIDDDGSELTRKHHRNVYEPSTDITTVPAGRVRQLANFVWTPAIISAWQNRPQPQI